MRKRFAAVGTCLLAGATVELAIDSAFAQTMTTKFDVRITITDECVLSGATDLDFGTVGVLDRNIDAESIITVQCTEGTPYKIKLNNEGLDTARDMDGPDSSIIEYNLYQDAARSKEWADTEIDIVSGTGTGKKQDLKVYGRVPPQKRPSRLLKKDHVWL